MRTTLVCLWHVQVQTPVARKGRVLVMQLAAYKGRLSDMRLCCVLGDAFFLPQFEILSAYRSLAAEEGPQDGGKISVTCPK